MAIYKGTIATSKIPIGAVRNTVKSGDVAIRPYYIGGVRGTVRQGLDLRNYNFVKFERVPRERILNRFKNLGGNIQY
ncbi:hypothetical protein FC777_11430 [Clostridium botulinum]|nr:hypothetical protein [Clostridium botulinum]